MVNNFAIDIAFSEPLSSDDLAANIGAFTVTGYEPQYSPGGSLQPATYAVDAVEWAPDAEGEVAVDLAGGDLTDLEVV